MKSVLISIQPYYVFLIVARIMGWDIPQEKTVEVRKDFPKDPAWNKVVHIYCSKDKKSFKRIPNLYQPLMKGFLGKVIGEFVCDRIDEYHTEFYVEDDVYQEIRRVWLDPDYDYPYEDFEIIASNDAENLDDNRFLKDSCITIDELKKYVGYRDKICFAWHISDLKIYDKPKGLGEFKTQCKEYFREESDCENCQYESDNSFIDCKCGGLKPLDRPPQPFFYVED